MREDGELVVVVADIVVERDPSSNSRECVCFGWIYEIEDTVHITRATPTEMGYEYLSEL